jgi:transcriptional regulator with XRE-family HTH domain
VRKGQAHEHLISLDAGQLQHFREQQGKTQRELAEAAGLTEDYISQIERGRNLVTKIETIARLALALHLLPEELIYHDPTEPAEMQWLRQEVLDMTPGIVLATLASNRVLLSWQDMQQMLQEKASIRLSTALPDELYISARGLWEEAEKQALAERKRYKAGSPEWAELTLRHCAWMCQQAGCLASAKAYIREVEQYYPPFQGDSSRSDPHIRALIHCQRGWFLQQQYGNYEQARSQFTTAARLAQEAGDQATMSTAHALLFCCHLEEAMTEAGAWLEARGRRTLSHLQRTRLDQSLAEDWAVSHHLDQDNPHNEYQRFARWCFVEPEEAQKARKSNILMQQARETETERFLLLHLARCALSEGEWDMAQGLAHEARNGLARGGFPQGIAFTAAIEAQALLNAGLDTRTDLFRCLDLWMLAFLCHPYRSHPLGKLAQDSLSRLVRYAVNHHQSWIRMYYHDLDARVLAAEKEGVFQALQYVRKEALPLTPLFAPTDYLLRCLPEDVQQNLQEKLES